MTTSTKEFDGVEVMYEGAKRIHETLKGKSRDEVLAYWRRRHNQLLDELEKAHETRVVGE